MFHLFNSPVLYAKFGSERTPNIVESMGNHAMTTSRGLFYFCTSLAFGPVILVYLYSRGYMSSPNSILSILRYAGYLAIFAYGGRWIGRLMDSEYREFADEWAKARDYGRSELNNALRSKYDFELKGVNPDFHAATNDRLWYLSDHTESVGSLTSALALYAVHAFGRHMLYPGSLGFFNWILSSNLNNARNIMMTAKNGKRAWLKTTEGDLIDTMYIVGSGSGPAARSRTLVISCEGNAGFYEIGVANTPSQSGYSVLGWNQPGFGESSGLPFPKNTLAAADAVMQYALSLGYAERDIVLFGWSIGGFPTSWLAVNYPNIRGVVLDATFDDVLPLAEARMPKLLGPVVQYAIRKHFNLNIQAILSEYKGPLKLIRRLQEEILITCENGSDIEKRATNRGNFLLKSVLRSRHPHLIKNLEPQVDRWLAMSASERRLATGRTLSSGEEEARRVELFAACQHYLTDFDSNHVTPLDPNYFDVPSRYNASS